MKAIEWTAPARADLRRLDRKTAMRIFEALHRFMETEEGNVKRVKGQENEFRLRVGGWRVRFIEEGNALQILRVRHRSEAYR